MFKQKDPTKFYLLGVLILIAGFSLYSILSFFIETQETIDKNYTSVIDGRTILANTCPPHCPTVTPVTKPTPAPVKKTPTYNVVSKPITPEKEPEAVKEFKLPELTANEIVKLKAGENPYIEKEFKPKLEIDPQKDPEKDPEKTKEKIQESLTQSKETELKDKKKITVINEAGNKEKIKEDTEIKVVLTFEEAEKELAKAAENVKIIYPGVDSDRDGIDDITEAILGTNPFNDDSDNDGITDTAEIFDYGSDPFTSSEIDLTPRVVNLDNHKTGPKPPIKGVGKPGEKVTIIAENIENGEKLTACETTPDDGGKFFCEPEENLPDGEYFLYSNHEGEDNRHIGKITVENKVDRHTPTSEVVEEYPKIVTVKLEHTEGILKKLLGEKLVTKLISTPLHYKFTKDQSKIQKVVGQALPGETVVATFESFILTSVVITDASQGRFELPISQKIEIGSHRILVYSLNSKNNFVSDIFNFIFSKI